MSSRVYLPGSTFFTTSLASNGARDPLGFHSPRHLRWRMATQRKLNETIREEDEQSALLEPVQLCLPIDDGEDDENFKPSDLRFNRLQQPSDRDTYQPRREFGHFVTRQALLHEEYWAAAWLRAESHWEDLPHDRYTESLKFKFAEQEFNAIKRRASKHQAQKCSCIVTVKKEDKRLRFKRTVLKSVVGTLDISIRYLLQGESFPGERGKRPLFCGIQKSSSNRYGYIANVVVTKTARRKGIATNMLLFALESAKSEGLEEIFIHVYRDSIGAQQLYQKIGFKIVENASPQLLEDKMYLLRYKV